MIKKFVSFLVGIIFSLCSFAADNLEIFAPLAKEQGFFFFYTSSCPHCQHFAPVLKRFSKRYGFKVVAISADGGFLPDFPDAVMNDLHAKLFHVTVFPSLFLVNPHNQLAALVSEGNINESELTARVLKIRQMQTEGSPL